MTFLNGYLSLLSLCHRHSQIHSLSSRSAHGIYLSNYSGKRWLSYRTESSQLPEFSGQNAYDVLGVSQSSSFSEIKSSFRKLAKQTHPDLAQSPDDSSIAQRFVQILAAYEILSDSEKRAHYDRYLLSQRSITQKLSRQGSVMYKYESPRSTMKQMEVVEWLKWYRFTINDILSERRVVIGSGYFDVLERDFYSAIHAAYYGPEIECMDLLPDCFEAEERSARETPEVLHLVSGRDLFGMVCIAESFSEISKAYNLKLSTFASEDSGLCLSIENVRTHMNSEVSSPGIDQVHNISGHLTSDAYKDLELHVSGKVVAVATRMPAIENEDSEDRIQVFLVSTDDSMSTTHKIPRDSVMDTIGSRIPLGTITGLGTSPEEGSCYVHNNRGIKTHVIMKHRTLLVCFYPHFCLFIVFGSHTCNCMEFFCLHLFIVEGFCFSSLCFLNCEGKDLYLFAALLCGGIPVSCSFDILEPYYAERILFKNLFENCKLYPACNGRKACRFSVY